MTIRSVPLVLTLAFLIGSVPAGLQAQADPSSYDLVIRGGRVVDGTGNPWFYADVGIRDGRIVIVGQLASVDATRVIESMGESTRVPVPES